MSAHSTIEYCTCNLHENYLICFKSNILLFSAPTFLVKVEYHVSVKTVVAYYLNGTSLPLRLSVMEVFQLQRKKNREMVELYGNFSVTMKKKN